MAVSTTVQTTQREHSANFGSCRNRTLSCLRNMRLSQRGAVPAVAIAVGCLVVFTLSIFIEYSPGSTKQGYYVRNDDRLKVSNSDVVKRRVLSDNARLQLEGDVVVYSASNRRPHTERTQSPGTTSGSIVVSTRVRASGPSVGAKAKDPLANQSAYGDGVLSAQLSHHEGMKIVLGPGLKDKSTLFIEDHKDVARAHLEARHREDDRSSQSTITKEGNDGKGKYLYGSPVGIEMYPSHFEKSDSTIREVTTDTSLHLARNELARTGKVETGNNTSSTQLHNDSHITPSTTLQPYQPSFNSTVIEGLLLMAKGTQNGSFADAKGKLKTLYSSIKETSSMKFGINVTESLLTSPNRDIDDNRPPECKRRSFPRFPLVSIVIPFYNEHHSVVIRTVHSILNTVPQSMDLEVLLVDDCSENLELQQPLQTYINNTPKVSLYRAKKREGLVRARILGAKKARGQVVVFIDAHVEMVVGWLEPLVDGVMRDPTAITVPMIGYIDGESMKPTNFIRKEYGSFSWELDFIWQDIPTDILNKPATEPVASATMIGCLFAVDRSYFFNTGAFDEHLDVWGGENLGISFRAWMCGGSVQLIRCSQVYHMFRKHLPYTMSDDLLYKNLQRVAEVWMDEYKQHYIHSVGRSSAFTPEEMNSITERKRLRERLKCRGFSWYLHKTSPELLTPPSKGANLWGQLKHLYINGCMNVTSNLSLSLDYCPLYLAAQTFTYREDRSIYHDISQTCLTFIAPHNVALHQCNISNIYQRWTFHKSVTDLVRPYIRGVDNRKPVGLFWVHIEESKWCLSQHYSNDKYFPLVEKCNHGNVNQYWSFLHKITYDFKIV